jgi:hypothetical protein
MVKSSTPKTTKTTKNQNEALKKYRKDLSILKKKGLIDPDYDVRNAVPTNYMRGRIKHFSDVISGKSTVWKVEPADYKRLIKSGERGANNHIVLPKGDRYVKGQVITPEAKKSKKAKKVKEEPKKEQTVEEFLKSEIEFPTLQPGEVYSFTFLGNRSRFSSRDPNELLKMLMNYPDVKEAFAKRDTASERAVVAAFEIASGDPKQWAESQKGRQSPKARWIPSGIPISEQIKNVGKPKVPKAGRADATGRTKSGKSARAAERQAAADKKYRASLSEEKKAARNAKKREAYRAKKEKTNA